MSGESETIFRGYQPASTVRPKHPPCTRSNVMPDHTVSSPEFIIIAKGFTHWPSCLQRLGDWLDAQCNCGGLRRPSTTPRPAQAPRSQGTQRRIGR